LQRVHGGALPRSPTSIHYAEREKESTAAKQQIGAAVAQLLRAGEVVVLDGGTTPLAVAEHLSPDLALTVVTHSLPAAEVLSRHAKAECVVVGGRLFKAARFAVGIAAVDAYRMLRPDSCVLGAAGIHPEAGVTTFDGEEAEV
jgi:DeoR/GlpR family transcriptional regulator of sugar metabolism